MKDYTEYEVASDLNKLAQFLARRDIEGLTSEEFTKRYGFPQADILIILGNSMPFIAELGAAAYKNGIAKALMIVGGIGHSTKYLTENIEKIKDYKGIKTENRPEADILQEVISRRVDIDANSIIIENCSKNCGENASEALKVIREKGEVPHSIIIIQDPTMQLRTHASFCKSWAGEKTQIISYSPFIPDIRVIEGTLKLVNGIPGIWAFERFIDILMGEVPRLKDDASGYGPKGKGFIAHVDIPEEILVSYNSLLDVYSGYQNVMFRK